MKINLHNYEAYLLDYMDGKLSATEVEEVILFLQQYPHIADELDGLQLTYLPLHEYSFDAQPLKKPTYDFIKKNYEPLLIAQLEGDASNSELTQLEQAIALYPELKHDAHLFALTKIDADAQIIFENKQLLKKQTLFLQFRTQFVRIAAILLLFAGFWLVATRISEQAPLPTTQLEKPEQLTRKNPLPRPTNTKPILAQSVKSKPILHSATTVVVQRTQILEVERVSNVQLLTKTHDLIAPPLSQTQSFIAYTQPVVSSDEKYMSLATLIKQKLVKSTRKAGIAIDKNEETGKITRVEIASLGIEWSHSK